MTKETYNNLLNKTENAQLSKIEIQKQDKFTKGNSYLRHQKKKM